MGHKGTHDPRQECPECDGEGRYESYRGVGRDPYDTVMHGCEACGGTGVADCDCCAEDALREWTTTRGETQFFYCSAACRLEDLGPDDEDTL